MTRRSERDREFDAFFVDNFDSILQSVAFACGDQERATDATQEAFIKAYARWNRVRRYENPAAWIRRVAIHHTRDMHRSETRRNRREQRVADQDTAVEPLHEGTGLELLSSLPDRQRAVAALFYLDDLPITEISELLAISEGTVRFHLSEARARLRSSLSPRTEDDHATR